ncbi:YqzL-like protein [Amphibacillus marinus]|uniref:YqzL-like protein n=1 Tax=Amphibacillus marinus TaxID=872970 RepID=A0A1H8HJ49_9BACI|nr:YqzL family protein [Amphibacillus marinus]SEN56220.1 YqzL-like protein [Amphibacillus marinus]
MHDLPWIVFSQTGNIETYLLMKNGSDQEHLAGAADQLHDHTLDDITD